MFDKLPCLTWQFEHMCLIPLCFSSVSPASLCITLSNGQIQVAQKMLWGVPVRKSLCVRGLDDKHDLCHRVLGTSSVQGWGCKRSLGVQSYPQHLLVQSSSRIIFDNFLLIHTVMAFSCCWMYLDRKSSLEQKQPTNNTGNFFALPFQLLLFLNMYLYPNITA